MEGVIKGIAFILGLCYGFLDSTIIIPEYDVSLLQVLIFVVVFSIFALVIRKVFA